MRATRIAALLAALVVGVVLAATVSAKDNPPGGGTTDAPGLNKDATTEDSSVGFEFEPGGTVGPGDHVPICHALGQENKDDFIAIAPSAGVVFGHAGSDHQSGEDTIPPFTYVDNQGDTNTSLASGQNWTAADMEIWADNCGESKPPPPGSGSLKVLKDFAGTASSDSAKVKLQIDSVDRTGEVGDGGMTGTINVSPGNHSVGETAGSGTDLGKYNSSISCKKGETTVKSGSGTSLADIPVGEGGSVVCTITNSPKSNGGGGGGGGGGSAALPALDLSIAKSASPTTVAVGGTITWTVTVTNNGATGASNVNVVDTLPAGVDFVSATPSQGSCTGTTCNLGSLASGTSATITIVTTATAAGELVNTATVTASQAESSTANNTATASAVAQAAFKPPLARRCGSIKVGIKQLAVGKKTVLRIVVKDTRGRLFRGAKVTIRGAGLGLVRKAGARGVVRLAVTPKKAGILRISAGKGARCSKRLGVLGAFQPPLTG